MCGQNSQMVEDDGFFFEPKTQIYCTTKIKWLEIKSVVKAAVHQ